MTALANGRRVSKNDIRIEACGAVDELASAMGMSLAFREADEAVKGLLPYQFKDILSDLMVLGAAIGGATKATHGQPLYITHKDVERLEAWIDASEEQLDDL